MSATKIDTVKYNNQSPQNLEVSPKNASHENKAFIVKVFSHWLHEEEDEVREVRLDNIENENEVMVRGDLICVSHFIIHNRLKSNRRVFLSFLYRIYSWRPKLSRKLAFKGKPILRKNRLRLLLWITRRRKQAPQATQWVKVLLQRRWTSNIRITAVEVVPNPNACYAIRLSSSKEQSRFHNSSSKKSLQWKMRPTQQSQWTTAPAASSTCSSEPRNGFRSLRHSSMQPQYYRGSKHCTWLM